MQAPKMPSARHARRNSDFGSQPFAACRGKSKYRRLVLHLALIHKILPHAFCAHLRGKNPGAARLQARLGRLQAKPPRSPARFIRILFIIPSSDRKIFHLCSKCYEASAISLRSIRLRGLPACLRKYGRRVFSIFCASASSTSPSLAIAHAGALMRAPTRFLASASNCRKNALFFAACLFALQIRQADRAFAPAGQCAPGLRLFRFAQYAFAACLFALQIRQASRAFAPAGQCALGLRLFRAASAGGAQYAFAARLFRPEGAQCAALFVRNAKTIPETRSALKQIKETGGILKIKFAAPDTKLHTIRNFQNYCGDCAFAAIRGVKKNKGKRGVCSQRSENIAAPRRRIEASAEIAGACEGVLRHRPK